jgi:hypothetical protein
MKKTKYCKHCNELFEARRSNHVYCTTSCKTKASYKRNNYKYISGHYKKLEVIPKSEEAAGLSEKTDIIQSIKMLEDKIDSIQKTPNINGVSVTNAAMGSVAADATVFGVKKIFAPDTLPATKGDIAKLANNLSQKIDRFLRIKNMQPNLQGEIPYFDTQKGELIYIADTFVL